MKTYFAKINDRIVPVTREELRSLPEGTPWGWSETEEFLPSTR